MASGTAPFGKPGRCRACVLAVRIGPMADEAERTASTWRWGQRRKFFCIASTMYASSDLTYAIGQPAQGLGKAERCVPKKPRYRLSDVFDIVFGRLSAISMKMSGLEL